MNPHRRIGSQSNHAEQTYINKEIPSEDICKLKLAQDEERKGKGPTGNNEVYT